ncbi:MAG: ureidoglycolate lyase [Devosiaceae bacterium]|nr:ureidoglycolate lyase [Devosiaceae bacterium MH13]
MRRIVARPLTAEAFAPYGDVLSAAGAPDKLINEGLCWRYHDRAALDFGDGGRAGVSIFKAELRALPYTLTMVERHPEGSQAFVPMDAHPFLVTVAPDEGGEPGTPVAFLTHPGEAINFHRGTWHGVLTPLHGTGLFAVIDRIGDSANLEEHRFTEPYEVVTAAL